MVVVNDDRMVVGVELSYEFSHGCLLSRSLEIFFAQVPHDRRMMREAGDQLS